MLLRIFAWRASSLTSSSKLRWILSDTHWGSDSDPFRGFRVVLFSSLIIASLSLNSSALSLCCRDLCSLSGVCWPLTIFFSWFVLELGFKVVDGRAIRIASVRRLCGRRIKVRHFGWLSGIVHWFSAADCGSWLLRCSAFEVPLN